jgi:hypothetical protein
MTRTPTPQQASCITAIKTHRMIKVEACAGSGKTSTLNMMAEATPTPSLYLGFNKVTATEAAEKFPRHVTCKTTHSVAYAAFGATLREKLSRPKGRYVNVAGTGSEIGKFYKLLPIELSEVVMLSSAYLGLLARQAVALFEQSADDKLTNRHLPRGELFQIAEKSQAKMDFTESVILSTAQKLWRDRSDVNSPVLATHDTYLKMYQLSKPVLAGFNVLYVDEFQDTTPCVLDIVLNQQKHMQVVMVGDARQAIYGWRGAVNAMKMVQCESRQLTKSFRYGQEIANIATKVLEGALQIEGNASIKSVSGFTCVDRTKPYTRLFRTNSALLTAAVAEIQAGTPVSIEVDVKDFVKLMQSAVALEQDKMKDVKHDKLLPFVSWSDMVLESKNDAELGRIVKVVKDGKVNEWIEVLSGHVNSASALVTFTTAHKSKGREFLQVVIEGDFKSCYNEDGEWVGLSEDEQNLLYVAVTRAIERLEYNQTVSEYLDRASMFLSGIGYKLMGQVTDRMRNDMREAMAA